MGLQAAHRGAGKPTRSDGADHLFDVTKLNQRISLNFWCRTYSSDPIRCALKGLSHEMEGGIKVVSIERSL